MEGRELGGVEGGVTVVAIMRVHMDQNFALV